MIKLSIGLAALLIIAVLLLVYALRSAKQARIFMPVLFVAAASVMYWQWGAYQALNQLDSKQHQQANAAEAFKRYKGPQEVILKMEAHLVKQPGSAKGWFLLGKLYASEKAFSKANAAFANAYALDKNNLEVAINYMESNYFINGQTMAGETKRLLDEILNKWPDQLDALNFAAMDAYTHKQYSSASSYWQKMLPLLPDGSKEKRAILKAIADAQSNE